MRRRLVLALPIVIVLGWGVGLIYFGRAFPHLGLLSVPVELPPSLLVGHLAGQVAARIILGRWLRWADFRSMFVFMRCRTVHPK